MKKSFVLLFFCSAVFLNASAQSIFVPGGFTSFGIGTSTVAGNVGIGTSTPLSPFQVSDGIMKISLGGVATAASGWITGYMGFNATKRATDWLCSGNGYQNGGSAIASNVYGDLSFFTIDYNGSADRSLTETEFMSKQRMTINRGGSVGIGTSAPAYSLDVYSGDIRTTNNLFFRGVGTGNGLTAYDGDPNAGGGLGSTIFSLTRQVNNEIRLQGYGPLTFYTNGNTGAERMRIDGSGNVGIGTSTPSSLFSIYNATSPALDIRTIGSGGATGGITIGVASFSGAYSSVATPGDAVIASRCGGSEDLILGVANVNNGAIRFTTNNSCNPGDVERMTILNNGNVGIGTTVTNSCKLAVAGLIGAYEIRVVANGSAFPDYVFAKDYKLKNINEVGEYISKNKHLPNIPSAKEIEDNGGINLGEMQIKHLEKTEELYLYVLELNRKMEALQQENKAMKKEIAKIKNR